MEKRIIFCIAFMVVFASMHAQVTRGHLDQIASHILAVNGINLYGDIIVSANRASGFAATSGNQRYSVIYVDPYQMRALSPHVWAFILGHELAHQYLAHRGSNPRNEFEADRYGAYWAYKAGYDVNTYLRYMATQPNVCTSSHGCWSARIQNIRNMFQTSYIYSNR